MLRQQTARFEVKFDELKVEKTRTASADAGDEEAGAVAGTAAAADDEDDEPDAEENLLEGLESDEAILATLTAHPQPEDVLLYVVALCGPYTALQKYKYKVSARIKAIAGVQNAAQTAGQTCSRHCQARQGGQDGAHAFSSGQNGNANGAKSHQIARL